MQPDKLIMMANQIATYFETQPGCAQDEQIAAHINDFWEPRMRARLVDHVARGVQGLSDLALAAAAHIRVPSA